MRIVCLFTAVAAMWASESKPDEPGRAAPPAADMMLGKEPGQVRDDNSLKLKLVWCPPGKFKMGTLKPEAGRPKENDPVEVTITQGFWLGRFEITQIEWRQVMRTQPWKGKEFTNIGDDYPATWISWTDATRFCRKFTNREREVGRLPEGWEYALPTEAQWERACRAGTETRFSFGDDESELGKYAWYRGNSWNAGEQYAHRVGLKRANPWGLHDMHGNVWEWCRDRYNDTLLGGLDPEVTKTNVTTPGSDRVIRGGSLIDSPWDCRSSDRSRWEWSREYYMIGFRVALNAFGK